MNATIIKFKKLTPLALSPTKAHKSDSGFDLYTIGACELSPGETMVVPTGICVQLPPGYEAQVRPRSGISSKTGLIVMLGTIDNGYTGPIGIIVKNVGEQIEFIHKGMKLAQLVPMPLPYFEMEETEDDAQTSTRGSAGFGSSDIKEV